MQNQLNQKIIQAFVLFTLLFFCFVPAVSFCNESTKNPTFRPIEWERDFTSSSSLSLGGFKLFNNSEIVDLAGQHLDSAYGLQLSQNLRDHWKGRVSFYCGRTGADVGQFVWSVIGSDLQHPLVSESVYDWSFIKYLRPFVFFGLGMTSRWANAGTGLNLIPTLRYEISEPIGYAGIQLQGKIASEFILAVEYRLLQSARASRERGHTLGASLIWGRMDD